MDPNKIRKNLLALDPCIDAKLWLAEVTGFHIDDQLRLTELRRAWDVCPRADWMVWLLGRCPSVRDRLEYVIREMFRLFVGDDVRGPVVRAVLDRDDYCLSSGDQVSEALIRYTMLPTQLWYLIPFHLSFAFPAEAGWMVASAEAGMADLVRCHITSDAVLAALSE